MQAATQLGDKVRVVSMPSTDVFDRQPAQYRESVLPDACRRRVAIEAGITDFWRKYVGLDGAVVGIDTFGASAPIDDMMRSEEHTSELQSLMRNSYAVFCLKKNTTSHINTTYILHTSDIQQY